MGASNKNTLINSIQAMSSLMSGNVGRGGVSSMAMSAPIANLMQKYQAQQDAAVEKMKELKKNVFGQNYEFEVDAGITQDTDVKTMIEDIKNIFYPLLISQNLNEFYCPPAVAAYLKLLSQYRQKPDRDLSTGVYLEGFVEDIEIWKMPREVFDDDFTCVGHTKDNKWFKAKVANVSRY